MPPARESILESRISLEGERKQVSVLFADLKDSMHLFVDRDPEDVRRVLEPLLDRMVESVHYYEGTVVNVPGDGIVALFGAPISHEDHAVRACFSALRLQDSVRTLAVELRDSEGIALQVRVGIHSGEVVVRSMAGDLRVDYSVTGQAMNIAARLEQMAAPDSILITTETLRLTEGYVSVHSLGSQLLKGLEAPIDLFEVTGPGPMQSRLQTSAIRGLSRFVGRRAELDQLHAALRETERGNGQLVALVGEPGVGKSRLVWEFSQCLPRADYLILESALPSYGRNNCFRSIISLLRGYFQISSTDPPSQLIEKVTQGLTQLDPGLQSLLTPLTYILGLETADRHWQDLEPRQKRQQCLDAARALFLRQSRMLPLLLVVDDLQWLDEETQEFLDSLVHCLPTSRILLVVSYRPEYRHSWSSRSFFRQLVIAQLSTDCASELLDFQLGKDAALDSLKTSLIAHTQGNPFFLEECLRTLVQSQVLAGERGDYRLLRESQGFLMPPSAQATLAARIDLLHPEDKRLLQAASVMEQEVSYSLLAALEEWPEAALRQRLATLQDAELLYEVRLFPEHVYTFRHALTHQVAYGSMLKHRRRMLHRKVMAAIERLHGDRLADHILQLADHAFRGEDWPRAASYLHQASVASLARSANREAVVFAERALLAMSHLPETRQTLEQSFELRIGLRAALWQLGEMASSLHQLLHAESLVRRLHDLSRLSQLAVMRSHHCLVVTGEVRQAIHWGKRAERISARLGDAGLRIPACLYLGTSLVSGGRFSDGEGFLREALALLGGGWSDQRLGMHGFPSCLVRSYLAWSLSERGEFDAAVTIAEEGMWAAERLQHMYSLTFACWGLGMARMAQGDLGGALPVLEQGVQLCGQWNLPSLDVGASSLLGLAYARSGRISDGLERLHHAQQVALAANVEGFYGQFTRLWLAEALLLADRPHDGLEVVKRLLAQTRASGLEVHSVWGGLLEGRILRRLDPGGGDAEKALLEALARATDLGMQPAAAHAHCHLAALLRERGRADQAGEQIRAMEALQKTLRMQPFAPADGSAP